MRIVGEWLQCDDGVIRPSVRVYVRGANGKVYADDFLIDSGADRTVFNAELAEALEMPLNQPPMSDGLVGVGGATGFRLVETAISLVRDDERSAFVRGEFAAFTDSRGSDLSILGRDVLDNFDLIISRRHDEVLLLAPNHQYHVRPA